MFLVSDIVARLEKFLGPRRRWDLQLLRFARWGSGEAEWYLLDLLVDRGKIAIDVGANYRVYSGRLAQLCRQVHAFEPNPQLAQELRGKLASNVTVHGFALSDRSGQAVLQIPIRKGVVEHGLASLEAAAVVASGASDVETVEVAVRSLDELGFSDVGFLKIDVQGHELAVLRGAERTLLRDRPTLLVESSSTNHPEAPHHVFRYLNDLRYCGLFVLDDLVIDITGVSDGSRPSIAYPPNFIFLPEPPSPALRARLERRVRRIAARRRAYLAKHGRA